MGLDSVFNPDVNLSDDSVDGLVVAGPTPIYLVASPVEYDGESVNIRD